MNCLSYAMTFYPGWSKRKGLSKTGLIDKIIAQIRKEILNCIGFWCYNDFTSSQITTPSVLILNIQPRNTLILEIPEPMSEVWIQTTDREDDIRCNERYILKELFIDHDSATNNLKIVFKKWCVIYYRFSGDLNRSFFIRKLYINFNPDFEGIAVSLKYSGVDLDPLSGRNLFAVTLSPD